jgi:hypothetical protein
MTSRIPLSKGGSVRLFTEPPTGFDPLSADDRELAVYGFPRRPSEDPRLMERWKTALSRPLRIIRPRFRPRDRVRLGVPKLSRIGDLAIPNPIWSGVAVIAPAGDSFSWIEGTWIVPNAYPPGNATNGLWYTASTWVGIDDMYPLQAGCDSDVLAQGSSLHRELNVWWEWVPGGSCYISNLPVAQGDTVSCLICAEGGTPPTGTVFLHNITSGLAAPFAVNMIPGIQWSGNTAEWIVEQISNDGDPAVLARYGETYFDGAIAGTVQHQVIDAGSGEIIQLVGANNNVISTATIETPTLVQVKYTGP